MKRNLTELAEWKELAKHQKDIASIEINDLFTRDPHRFSQFSLEVGCLLLDYSKNRINKTTLSLLVKLAESINLPQTIDKFFSGALVNTSERRPALHTALRDKSKTPLFVEGIDITSIIMAAQKKMGNFVEQIHTKKWKGITNKSINHIVNIGIGGSYLGPMMCIQALKDFCKPKMHSHFIASPDQAQLDEVLAQINPEKTLFIISSKTFTTIETLTNAKKVLDWMQEKFGIESIKKHFVAVTLAPEKAVTFGIPQENVFPLWDWVGGRYSVWAATGLPLALMIGNENFAEFLAGGYEMDQHFRHADLVENMPVILALLALWYINFFGASAQAIAPYSYRLRYLVPYLQQAEMESSGKRVMHDGTPINYTTGSVIFGDEGNIAQHAYHQLLLQGSHLIPVDFILVGQSFDPKNHVNQDILVASGLSQSEALMRGKALEEAKEELRATGKYTSAEVDYLAQFKEIPGNKPSNILFLEKITPKNLGALLALYEHKIFVQSVLWNINPFDQWGVELGKELLPNILALLKDQTKQDDFPPEISGLIKHYKKLK